MEKMEKKESIIRCIVKNKYDPAFNRNSREMVLFRKISKPVGFGKQRKMLMYIRIKIFNTHTHTHRVFTSYEEKIMHEWFNDDLENCSESRSTIETIH
jgi:hypothetical protein